MRYKLLGRSGLRVSELALGAMTFGTESGIGVEKSRWAFDAYLQPRAVYFAATRATTPGGGAAKSR